MDPLPGDINALPSECSTAPQIPESAIQDKELARVGSSVAKPWRLDRVDHTRGRGGLASTRDGKVRPIPTLLRSGD
jgi:hypothetical protein